MEIKFEHYSPTPPTTTQSRQREDWGLFYDTIIDLTNQGKTDKEIVPELRRRFNRNVSHQNIGYHRRKWGFRHNKERTTATDPNTHGKVPRPASRSIGPHPASKRQIGSPATLTLTAAQRHFRANVNERGFNIVQHDYRGSNDPPIDRYDRMPTGWNTSASGSSYTASDFSTPSDMYSTSPSGHPDLPPESFAATVSANQTHVERPASLGANEVFPWPLGVTPEEWPELQLLQGFWTWSTRFWDADPQGRATASYSALEVTMVDLVIGFERIHFSDTDEATYNALQNIPRHFSREFFSPALQNVLPHGFVSVVSHLITLLSPAIARPDIVNLCLQAIAYEIKSAMGATYPLALLFDMATNGRITLEFCARLWNVIAHHPVARRSDILRQWRVRQDAWFGMILHRFGYVRQAREHLWRTFHRAVAEDFGIDELMIEMSLEYFDSQRVPLRGSAMHDYVQESRGAVQQMTKPLHRRACRPGWYV